MTDRSQTTTVFPEYPLLPDDRRPTPIEILNAALTYAWSQAPWSLDTDEAERLVQVLHRYGYSIEECKSDDK